MERAHRRGPRAAAGWSVTTGEGEWTHGPTLRLARVAVRGRAQGLGSAFVQLDGAGGQARLLDAVVQLEPTSGLTLRAGRFKAPVSAEFLIPAPQQPMIRRALLSRLVLRRAPGAELVASFGPEETRLGLHAGLFAPGLPDDKGVTAVGRIGIETDVGVGLHAAVAHDLHDDGAEQPPDGEQRPSRRTQMDLALTFERWGFTAHLEGLVVLDVTTTRREGGALILIARRFDDLEPVLAWDGLVAEGDSRQRLTPALNWYLRGHALMARLNYELTYDGPTEHAVLVELQAGI